MNLNKLNTTEVSGTNGCAAIPGETRTEYNIRACRCISHRSNFMSRVHRMPILPEREAALVPVDPALPLRNPDSLPFPFHARPVVELAEDLNAE